MPCIRANNGKWKWGYNGRPIYETKEECEKAGIAILIDRLIKIRRRLTDELNNTSKKD